MSSIASLRRTDTAVLPGAVPRWVPTAVAVALFSALMISFTPFQTYDPTQPPGGNIVNQLGYGSLGAVSVVALALLSTPRLVTALLGPSMLVLIGFLLLSVADATDPASAFRAASFTLIGILAICAIFAIPRDSDAFGDVLATTGLLVTAVCYVGLILYPTIAVHTAESFEPQHAGLWRGVFTHKNIAGPVMACFSFAGLYLLRRGRRLSGAVLFTSAMVFMLNTGSKTTAGLVPVAMIVVAAPGLFGIRALTALMFWGAVVGTALATLGIVFIEPLKQFATVNFPDLTYTGRVTLWEFSGEMIRERPWTGYGYESFWMTPFMDTVYQPFDREWDIRAIVHGHNGYLDIALIMGIPALAVAIWAFLIAPVIDFLRIPRLRENVLLGDLCMMIVLFTALNAFLESFFFRRADPVWLFFVFGLVGLRLAARFPMRTHES